MKRATGEQGQGERAKGKMTGFRLAVPLLPISPFDPSAFIL
jgi:hypothetical protein